MWLRLGAGPRRSTTACGGATRTTTSAAIALKAKAPEKTRPINRFVNMTSYSFSSWNESYQDLLGLTA
jgi:hypothetical protein